jgi:hypothetical protein
MKIVKYVVVVSYSPGNLAAQVNDHIEDGWQPLGGVSSYAKEDGSPGFQQAIVLYGEKV